MKSWYWLLVILILAAVLRFYNLSGYLQFLGDQGRDVLVVKRMIVDHKWTLLGPSASVGGFFTGPIYYYFMLPFLWLFNLDPVGPAVLSAILGTVTVALLYWLGTEFFGKQAGIIAAFLAAISPKMVEISRYSWNPNPVPFFALLTAGCLYLAAVKKRVVLTFLTGIFLGILIQLHYMNAVLVVAVGLVILFAFSPRHWLKNFLALGTGFLLGNSLFLIFELRHGFPNSQTIWEFVTRGGQTVAPRSANFIWLVLEILRRLYGMTLAAKDTIWEWVYLLPSLFALAWWVVKSKDKVKILLLVIWLLAGAFGVGSYRGQLHDHYFGFLYPLPFLLLGLAGSLLLRTKLGWLVFLAGGLVLTTHLVRGLYFWQPPNQMLSQIQEIDRIVLEYADDQPYNLGLISNSNTDDAYRYYLEIWGWAPTTIENEKNDPLRQTVTDRLIVICEEKKCEPLGHPRWEIAGFGQGEIVGSKMGPAGISVYKLVHYEESQKLKVPPRPLRREASRRAGKS